MTGDILHVLLRFYIRFYFTHVFIFFADAVGAARHYATTGIRRHARETRKKEGKKKKRLRIPKISSFISLQRGSQRINALCRATLAFRPSRSLSAICNYAR